MAEAACPLTNGASTLTISGIYRDSLDPSPQRQCRRNLSAGDARRSLILQWACRCGADRTRRVGRPHHFSLVSRRTEMDVRSRRGRHEVRPCRHAVRHGCWPCGRLPAPRTVHFQSVRRGMYRQRNTRLPAARIQGRCAFVPEPLQPKLLRAEIGLIWFRVRVAGDPQHASGFLNQRQHDREGACRRGPISRRWKTSGTARRVRPPGL